MADKTPRAVKKLLKMIEEKENEIFKCEEEIERARQKLENKERGWTKARYQKMKIKLNQKIRGLRGTANRLEKQRLNIERREREREEEELEDIEKSLAIEEEEERALLKKRKARKRKRQKVREKKRKRKKKKKKVKKATKKLSPKEKKMVGYGRTFIKEYRLGIKAAFKRKKERKKRKGFELYGKFPYRLTIVYKEPEIVETETKAKPEEGKKVKKVRKKVVKVKEEPLEVMLVFSEPGLEKLKVDFVEDKAFDISEYKDIFRTIVTDVKKWSEKEAAGLSKEYLEKDLP
jgi:hypothetical protein